MWFFSLFLILHHFASFHLTHTLSKWPKTLHVTNHLAIAAHFPCFCSCQNYAGGDFARPFFSRLVEQTKNKLHAESLTSAPRTESCIKIIVGAQWQNFTDDQSRSCILYEQVSARTHWSRDAQTDFIPCKEMHSRLSGPVEENSHGLRAPRHFLRLFCAKARRKGK